MNNIKFKDLPKNELPRERFIKYGVERLSNEELLSIIIRTGTKDTSVKEVSNNILSKVSSINDLNNITLEELSNIKGVGIVKAITIKASIEFGKRVSNTEKLAGMMIKILKELIF